MTYRNEWRDGDGAAPRSALRRVLVGVDGSAASSSAVSAAIELVAPTGTIHLARVVSTSAAHRFSDWLRSGGLTGAARAQREVLAGQSLARVAAAVRRATSAGVEVEDSRGDVADELLRLAAQREAELLVIGDRRTPGFGRRFLDGVAGRLAKGPQLTLVVPEGADLRRVRDALVLAAEPLPGHDLARARAALAPLAPRHAFRSLRGAHRALFREIRSAPPSTVLVVPRRTVSELGARWVLNQASCPVLFLPSLRAPERAPHDTVAAYAAWHGDVALFSRALTPTHHLAEGEKS